MTFYWQTTTTTPKSQHPSTAWANWKAWEFVYYDRVEWVEKTFELPKEIVVIADSWSVKGYLADKWWCWSNEIYSFANDVLTVRSNNWEELYKWLRKEIKDKVKSVGLKLTKNIHFFDPKNPEEIKTICIKGAALKSFLEVFADENRNAPAYKRIKLDKVAEGKTWAVKYTYPVFAPATDLTAEDRVNQQKLWAELVNYKNQAQADAEAEEVAKEVADSELPF